MKLALGLMYANEKRWLSLHLPVFSGAFDGIVAVGDDDTDGSTDYLRSIGANVTFRRFEQDWSAQFNAVIDRAESLGYTHILRLDPDEAIFAADVARIRDMLTNDASLLVLARHEFCGDRKHVRGDLWPDYQARAFALHRGIRLSGKKHEGIDFAAHGLLEHTADSHIRVLRVVEPAIFHYGWSSPQAIWNNQVKYQKLAQIDAGGPPEVAFPSDWPLTHFDTVEFTGEQPISPDVCGLYAPFTKEWTR